MARQFASATALTGRTQTVGRAFAIAARSMRAHPGLAALFLAATLSQGLLQALLVWALREVLRRLGESHAGSPVVLLGAGGLVLVVWLLRAVSTYLGEVLAARLGHRVETDSMRGLLRKLVTLSIRFFDQSSRGDLVMSAYVDLKGVRQVTIDVGNVILFASRLAALAAVAYVMSPRLALVGLVTIPIGLIPAHHLGRRITQAAHGERTAAVSLYDVFLQIATGIRLLKVNRGEGRVLAQADEIGQRLYRHVVRQAEHRSLSRFLFEAVSGLGLITVLVLGGREVAAGRLDWQSLLSLLIAVMAVYSPILGLLQVYGSIRSMAPSLERIQEILRAAPDVADAPDALPLPAPPRVITLEDVSFRYEEQWVLDRVSAVINRGETIGVVGPSGAGKSTLIALLLRFYDPTSGRILLDGLDLRRIRHADLMDQCAIVMQEPQLLLDTVANNIRWSRPSATMDDVVAAATAANIHDEILEMSQGYETVVGTREDARGISVGQKQRICIASALLKNAPLLFLDEATSNLDSVSERKVQGAVERLMQGRTSIVIAHRLSTLRRAHRILVLDRGRLVGFGPHRELLAECPTYERLWRSQIGALEPAAPGLVRTVAT